MFRKSLWICPKINQTLEYGLSPKLYIIPPTESVTFLPLPLRHLFNSSYWPLLLVYSPLAFLRSAFFHSSVPSPPHPPHSPSPSSNRPCGNTRNIFVSLIKFISLSVSCSTAALSEMFKGLPERIVRDSEMEYWVVKIKIFSSFVYFHKRWRDMRWKHQSGLDCYAEGNIVHCRSTPIVSIYIRADHWEYMTVNYVTVS